MQVTAERVREATNSIWMDVAEVRRQEPLPHDTRTEICVVGAGIAGLSAAYHLAREGKKVVLLDDGPVGGGQTERTSAHLSNAIDDRYIEIERIHGEVGSRMAAESHTAAIERIELIVKDESIDCEFNRLSGYLFLGEGDTLDLLEREREAAHRAGLTDVEFVHRAPMSDFNTGRCLRFPRQAQFHPLKYLRGLAEAFERLGGLIQTTSHVAKIDGGLVETDGGSRVNADVVIVATNTPVNDLVAIHTKQAPYQTYVIAAPIPHGNIDPALYWDTLHAYHYIRLEHRESGDHVMIGGEDHKVGQTTDQAERWGRLEAWALERFPKMGAVDFRWSGQVMETTDGLAFIGRNPGDKENVFIATGDSGMGMTHGTIAGMLLTDLIMGRKNPWSDIYDPFRKPVWGMAWKNFLAENANVALEYAKDWLGSGDVSSVEEIGWGEGAVVRRGLTKVAVFRDGRGHAHELSAICPHLGCIVHWNRAEKTWDCPCHGSRFDPEGRVICGPANTPLKEA